MGSPNLFSQFTVDMKGAEVVSLTQLTSTQMLGGSKTKQLTVATSSCPSPFYETKNNNLAYSYLLYMISLPIGFL